MTKSGNMDDLQFLLNCGLDVIVSHRLRHLNTWFPLVTLSGELRRFGLTEGSTSLEVGDMGSLL